MESFDLTPAYVVLRRASYPSPKWRGDVMLSRDLYIAFNLNFDSSE
jgi:hypothetical protein